VAAFVRIIVGVYAAPCGGAKFFTSTVEGVALRAGYTDAARQKVLDLIVRDHLPLPPRQRRSPAGSRWDPVTLRNY
jgi:hypothetical protein